MRERLNEPKVLPAGTLVRVSTIYVGATDLYRVQADGTAIFDRRVPAEGALGHGYLSGEITGGWLRILSASMRGTSLRVTW